MKKPFPKRITDTEKKKRTNRRRKQTLLWNLHWNNQWISLALSMLTNVCKSFFTSGWQTYRDAALEFLAFTNTAADVCIKMRYTSVNGLHYICLNRRISNWLLETQGWNKKKVTKTHTHTRWQTALIWPLWMWSTQVVCAWWAVSRGFSIQTDPVWSIIQRNKSWKKSNQSGCELKADKKRGRQTEAIGNRCAHTQWESEKVDLTVNLTIYFHCLKRNCFSKASSVQTMRIDCWTQMN